MNLVDNDLAVSHAVAGITKIPGGDLSSLSLPQIPDFEAFLKDQRVIDLFL